VPGQRLRFVRLTKHFDRADTVEVVATEENGLRVRRADGTEASFIPANVAASFDVGEARELKVAAGDRLLLQANHGKEFINGERVQVREIQNDFGFCGQAISGAKLNFLAVVFQVLHVPLFQRGKVLFHFASQNCTNLVKGFASEALGGFLKTGSVL